MIKTPRGIQAERAHSYASLESMATRFRAGFGLADPTIPVDGLRLYDLVQDFPIPVGTERHRIFCRVGELPDGLEAKAMFVAETRDYDIVLTPRTYEWLEKKHPRGKSGLVHECSHVFLHPRLLQQLSTLPLHSRAALYRGSTVPHSFCCDTEWQADALTGAITMPARGIAQIEEQRARKVSRWPMETILANHFEVSMEAAGYRWETYQQRKSVLLKA